MSLSDSDRPGTSSKSTTALPVAPTTPPPTPTAAKVNYYRTRASDTMSAWGRWVQRSLSRDSLVAGIKTSTWLVPLTILIWIYAEREQIYNAEDRTIPIEVRSGNDRYVELRMPMNDKNVMATLSGPRGRVEEILQRIQPNGERPTVVITIDQSLPPGEVHRLDTAQLLASAPIFARSGVTIKNCKPAQVPVFVDQYKDYEAEVQPPEKMTNLVGTPIFEPQKVRIRAPSSKLPVPAPTVVFADLQSTGLTDKPGQHDTVQVRVASPKLQGEGITIQPSSVKASFEVRQANMSYKISSVVIFPIAPKYLMAKYYPQCNDTLPNVTVIGPPDQIARLDHDESLKPRAILEYSKDDLPVGTPRSKLLKFEFPDAISDVRVSPEDAQRTIDYTLVERPPE